MGETRTLGRKIRFGFGIAVLFLRVTHSHAMLEEQIIQLVAQQ